MNRNKTEVKKMINEKRCTYSEKTENEEDERYHKEMQMALKMDEYNKSHRW